MKTFFLRLGAILLIVFFQLSFLNVLFPSFTVPLLLFSAVIAWTLLRGFPLSLQVTVPLTLLFDSVTYAEISFVSVYAVLLAYGTTFLSKRLMIEHRGMSLALYAIFAAIGAFGYQLLALFLHSEDPFALLIDHASLSSDLSFSLLLIPSLISIPIFMLSYYALMRFERWEHSLSQKQFLNIR